MATAFSYAQLKAALWAGQGARVHAVIDALVVPGLPQRLESADSNGWDCLQRGALSAERAQAVAYLVELKNGAPFTDWLLGEAPATYPGWGVLTVSAQALLPMREHCRGLGDVTTPEGERRAWRWYDPEVLQLILPSLSATQLDELFAANQTFVIPSASGWTWHALEQGVLASTVRELMASAA
ncbi:MAG TPA: DUF4123 domain-containing protein [Caldimonas sp.]